jgi:hypothetical protein
LRNQLPELDEADREQAEPYLRAGAAMSAEEVVRFAIDTLQAKADDLG